MFLLFMLHSIKAQWMRAVQGHVILYQVIGLQNKLIYTLHIVELLPIICQTLLPWLWFLLGQVSS
jgi:hypothetical protein